MPPEWMALLPRSVVYIVLAVVVLGFTLSRLAEAFESVANMLGPPGRWVHRRYKTRAKRVAAREADYKLLQWRIDKQEKVIRKNEATSEAKIRKLEVEIKKNELVEETNAAKQDMITEYLREDAQWHIDASLLAAEQGLVLPKHRSFTKFCSEYRAKHGMEYGRRWSDEPKR